MVNNELSMNGEQVPSQAAVGRVLGLSPATMSKLKKQGMPVHSVEAAQTWREARQSVAARKPLPATASTFAPLPTALAGEGYDAARTRREIAEANLAELKEAEQQGRVIQVEAVRAAWARRLAGTRDAILQIPIRVAPILAAETSIEQVSILLETELRQALAELSRDGLPGGSQGATP